MAEEFGAIVGLLTLFFFLGGGGLWNGRRKCFI